MSWTRWNGCLGVVCLHLSLATVACGPPRSDADQVRDTITTVWQAFTDGDGGEACSHLTGNAQRQLVGRFASLGAGTCTEAVETAAGSLGAEEKEKYSDIRVGVVEVSGDRARVPDSQVTIATGEPLPDDDPASMTLVEIDGDWRIDDFG